MKLNIPERIALLNILPAEGDVISLRIVRDLKNALSFTEQEVKRFKMKNTMKPDGSGAIVIWDSKFTNVTKDIKIGDVARDIIVGQLKALDNSKKLRLELLDLYDKFVSPEERLGTKAPPS